MTGGRIGRIVSKADLCVRTFAYTIVGPAGRIVPPAELSHRLDCLAGRIGLPAEPLCTNVCVHNSRSARRCHAHNRLGLEATTNNTPLAGQRR